MQIKKPLTDDRIIEMIREQLSMVTVKDGAKYNSVQTIMGVLTTKQHELLHVVKDGGGYVTSPVLRELIDIAVVCIRGARSYLHGGVDNGVHGL